ncbi:MAG: hypothetical protein WCH21_02280 [Bacteroidota bacterium]
MNINLKLTKENLICLTNTVYLLFGFNMDDNINYTLFYNLTNITNRLARIKFSTNFSTRKNYTFTLSPNDATALLELINMSLDILENMPYEQNLLITICAEIDKQTLNNMHNIESFKNKILIEKTGNNLIN